MKATGMVRKFDNLGRIVIPKEIRTNLGVDIGDAVEFYVDGQCIVVKKYDPACNVEQLLDSMEHSIQTMSALLTPAQHHELLDKMKEMKKILKTEKPIGD